MLADSTGSHGRRLDEDGLREMMIGYQRAEAEAAEQLVRALSPLLLRFLSSPGQSRSETEDLAQECWLRIHKARHTYRPSEPVLPWIFAIARHTRLDGYRRRLRRREIGLEGLPEPADARAARSEHDLHRLLENLPEAQRQVVLMLKVAGMSLEEVARATSSTVGAVKQKAHRAYARLRTLLGERHEHAHKNHA